VLTVEILMGNCPTFVCENHYNGQIFNGGLEQSNRLRRFYQSSRYKFGYQGMGRQKRIFYGLDIDLELQFDLPEVGSSRFSWLVEPLSLDELEAALDQCKNTCPSLDGLGYSLYKAY
jgi:hypothetical protein